MNNKIQQAIVRLHLKLPLKQNQQNLSPELRQLHRDILYSYIDIGRSLNADEIASRIDDVEMAVQTLKQNDLVVFDDSGEPIGAYPFTMEKREHVIKVGNYTVHCMCALDALAVSPMYDISLEIHSVCHISHQAIIIKQHGFEINNDTDVSDVYFAINWAAAASDTCCADSLCTEMIFIKGESEASNWNKEDTENRQIFALDEAVKFAAGFFVPLVT